MIVIHNDAYQSIPLGKNNSLPCSVLDKILDIIIDFVPDAELPGDKD